MQQDILLKAMKDASTMVTEDRITDVTTKMINSQKDLDNGYPYGHHQSIIAIEELGELQQAISKKLRFLDNTDNLNLTEELADVLICIRSIMTIYEIPNEDVNKVINVKLAKIEKAIQTYGECM